MTYRPITLRSTTSDRWLHPDGYDLYRLPNPAPRWWHLVYQPTPLWRYEPTLRPLMLALADPVRLIWADRVFVTDLGSVPRLGQLILPAASFVRSFAFHDFCYRFCGIVIDGVWVTLTRAQADEMLRRGLIAEGATEAQARLVWAAVRSFGWMSWRGGK